MRGSARAAAALAAAVLLLAGCNDDTPTQAAASDGGQGQPTADSGQVQPAEDPADADPPTPTPTPQTLAEALQVTADSGRTARFTFRLDEYSDDGEGDAGWKRGTVLGMKMDCGGVTDFVAAERGGCVFAEDWAVLDQVAGRAGDLALAEWATSGDRTLFRTSSLREWRPYDPQPAIDEESDALEFFSPLQIRLQLAQFMHETGPGEGLIDWQTHTLFDRGTEEEEILQYAAERGVEADSLEDLIAQIEGVIDENGYDYTLTSDGLLKAVTLRQVLRNSDNGSAWGMGIRLKFDYTDEPVAVTLPKRGSTGDLPGTDPRPQTSTASTPDSPATDTGSSTSAVAYVCDTPLADLPPLVDASASATGTRALQTLLRDLGYSPGPVDGQYGPQTQAAVRAYQADTGLYVDAQVGPKTWGALRDRHC